MSSKVSVAYWSGLGLCTSIYACWLSVQVARRGDAVALGVVAALAVSGGAHIVVAALDGQPSRLARLWGIARLRRFVAARPLGVVGRLLENVLHVLRGHLTTIRAAAQLGLLRKGAGSAESFEQIIRSCDMLNEGIDDLASLSARGAEPQAVDLRTEIEVAMGYAEGRALLAGATITTRLPEQILAAVANRRQLRLAISLLISVVAETAGGGGTVCITAAATPACSTIRISGAGGCSVPILPRSGDDRAILTALAQQIITTQSGFVAPLTKTPGFTILLPPARLNTD